jgi:hypothetical protein
MSFVPAPQQANAASAKSNAPVTSPQAASAAAEAPVSDQELLFKIRTFDVFWVDKQALMYKDGIAKVRRILHTVIARPTSQERQKTQEAVVSFHSIPQHRQ